MNAALPRWAYLALAVACAGMGFWSSVVTLQFFEHGATALETDAALQALAKGAALLFVFGEMAAFTLAALLTGRALKARRWMLYGFAGAVLVIEVFTISAVQMAMVTGADLTQTSLSDGVADLQKQIEAAEKSAASFSATAQALRADKQVSKALKADGKATAEQAKASQLYERLEKARTQKRPTLTGLLGEKTALSYAIARGILVSLAGLVFFGTAGALLRAARGGVLSIDQQILALLHELRGTPVHAALQAQAVAPAGPAPALGSAYRHAGAVAPAGAPVGVSYGGRAMLAGAGLLAATAAPMAHSAPAVPAAPAAGQPVNVDTPSPVNVDTPEAPQKARKARVVRDGAVMDSGLSEHDGARYRRALAGVRSGKIRPSLAGLAAGVDASAPVARRYLGAMADAGVIAPSGRGYALVKKGGAA